MGKRIVILNGSPRKNGNTSALVKAFTNGAENSGHTVTTFFLSEMNIHGCKGCFGGHSSQECPCVQKDDMARIYLAMKESDVVVLATPLYYWNMSGQIRIAIDRLFALEEGNDNLLRGHNRGSALLMAAEGHNFDDVLTYYTAAAVRYCRHVVDEGYMPVASHLMYPQILNDSIPAERELGLAFGLALLKICDEVWVFGDISPGMEREIEEAKRFKKQLQHIKEAEV